MNKLGKGKIIGILTCSLAAASLVGVGFSAWVINGTNTIGSGDITVNVADVEDKRITLSNANVTDSSVRFDCLQTATEGSLLNGSGTDYEDLVFKVTYQVSNPSESLPFKVFAYFSDSSVGEKYKSAQSYGLISLPDGIGLSSTEKGNGILSFNGTAAPTVPSGQVTNQIDTISAKASTYSVNHTFTFKWGAAFANLNPSSITVDKTIYDYNNASSPITNNKEQMISVLKTNISELKTLIGGESAKFALTLEVQLTENSSN